MLELYKYVYVQCYYPVQCIIIIQIHVTIVTVIALTALSALHRNPSETAGLDLTLTHVCLAV